MTDIPQTGDPLLDKVNQEVFKLSKNTNEIFNELIRQLIFVGTVFISLSGLAIFSNQFTTQLTILEKWLLVISWILGGVSIIFGVIQLLIDYRFFRKWLQKWNQIGDARINGKEVVRDNIPHHIESNTFCGYVQMFTIVFAFIIFVFTLSKVLLNI